MILIFYGALWNVLYDPCACRHDACHLNDYGPHGAGWCACAPLDRHRVECGGATFHDLDGPDGACRAYGFHLRRIDAPSSLRSNVLFFAFYQSFDNSWLFNLERFTRSLLICLKGEKRMA